MSSDASSTEIRPAEKLRDVRVGLREDLEVSRHVFRGAPAYVVRDPITFQSQRLDPEDYRILCRITADRSLGATFKALVADGLLDEDDEDRFFEFILSLHGLGFLRLPLSDSRLLYRRYIIREQLKRREKLSSILYLRIPLWNPNAFLDRTIEVIRPLFSPVAFAGWFLLMIGAGYVALRNWHDLVNPLHNMLVADNLLLMWLTLIVLKVFHEFGHAYACKHYGGHVPEMGVSLIMLTPCAYVDATAAWGFPARRHRLFVSLAGMYVEMAMAAVAVIVWALTGPSLINSLAHNAIFLASAVTILFNINPLMRYDGYYILCDLLEIPNLRARATRCLLDQTKRILLGIAPPEEPGGRRLTAILCTFGIGAALYRASLMIAITAVLASKMFMAGMMVGLVILGKTLSSTTLKLTRFLWYAEETTGRRIRAVAISVVVLLLVPAGVMWLPVRNNVYAAGVTGRAQEVVVRASTPGFVEAVYAQPGIRVPPSAPLVHLTNDAVREQLAEAEARLRAAEIRCDAYRETDPALWAQEQAASVGIRAAVEAAREQYERLRLAAPIEGDVIQTLTENDTGRYLARGEPVATLAAGSWRIRTMLTADQLAAAQPRNDTRIIFRPASDPRQRLVGRIVQIVPAGAHAVNIQALTHLGGRNIAVDPATHQAAEPYFELVARLDDAPENLLRVGLTGELRLEGRREPIGIALTRRVIRFWNKLRRD